MPENRRNQKRVALSSLIRVLVGITVVGCAGNRISSVSFDREGEENAIYAVILDHYFRIPPEEQGNRHWRILSTTPANLLAPDAEPLDADELADLAPATVADYRRANMRPRRITPPIQQRITFALVEPEALDSVWEAVRSLPPEQRSNPEPFWTVLKTRFPSAVGVITLSRAGFRPDGNQALVYVAYNCPGLCGAATLVMLEKKPLLGWQIAEELTLIVS